MSILLSIAALLMVPVDDVVTDEVDRIELSHVYDDCGNKTLSQLIFYDWNADDSRFDVVDWRLVRAEAKGMRPAWQAYNRRWEATWRDGDGLRRVRSKAFRERWDQFDPELREREFLGQDRRRKLSTPHTTAVGDRIE